MKRILAAVAFGLTFVATASAQQAPAALQVHAGDVYTVTMTDTQTMKVGNDEKSVTVSQVYQLDVIDAQHWRYTPVSMDMSAMRDMPEMQGMNEQAWAAMGDALSAMMRLAADIGFECHVDEHGRCLELTNLPAWSMRAENFILMADAFARFGQAMPPPATTVEDEVQPSRAKANTDDAEESEPGVSFNWEQYRLPTLRAVALLIDGFDARAAATWMAPFHPAAEVQGRSMTRGQTEAINEQWAMPYGAPPVLMTGTLTMQRIDQRAGTATFVRRASIDQQGMRASLSAMSNYMLGTVLHELGPALQDGTGVQSDPAQVRSMVDMFLNMFTIDIQEQTTGVVDLGTGMAKQTSTDFVYTLRQTGNRDADPVVVRQHHELRITRGAPPVPRLPRPQGT